SVPARHMSCAAGIPQPYSTAPVASPPVLDAAPGDKALAADERQNAPTPKAAALLDTTETKPVPADGKTALPDGKAEFGKAKSDQHASITHAAEPHPSSDTAAPKPEVLTETESKAPAS